MDDKWTVSKATNNKIERPDKDNDSRHLKHTNVKNMLKGSFRMRMFQ